MLPGGGYVECLPGGVVSTSASKWLLPFAAHCQRYARSARQDEHAGVMAARVFRVVLHVVAQEESVIPRLELLDRVVAANLLKGRLRGLATRVDVLRVRHDADRVSRGVPAVPLLVLAERAHDGTLDLLEPVGEDDRRVALDAEVPGVLRGEAVAFRQFNGHGFRLQLTVRNDQQSDNDGRCDANAPPHRHVPPLHAGQIRKVQ
jgi:hypothetical protein